VWKNDHVVRQSPRMQREEEMKKLRKKMLERQGKEVKAKHSSAQRNSGNQG
jgi:hypothetical protein